MDGWKNDFFILKKSKSSLKQYYSDLCLLSFALYAQEREKYRTFD